MYSSVQRVICSAQRVTYSAQRSPGCPPDDLQLSTRMLLGRLGAAGRAHRVCPSGATPRGRPRPTEAGGAEPQSRHPAARCSYFARLARSCVWPGVCRFLDLSRTPFLAPVPASSLREHTAHHNAASLLIALIRSPLEQQQRMSPLASPLFIV